jgi:hypothetical protein
MSITSKLALVATLATLTAAPAFAGDQDSNTLLQDSGRYVPVAQIQARGFAPNAYASARGVVHNTQVWHSQNASQDFQLQGR